MKKAVIIAGWAVVLFAGGYVGAQDGQGESRKQPEVGLPTAQTPQTVCPVMGGRVNKDLYYDFGD